MHFPRFAPLALVLATVPGAVGCFGPRTPSGTPEGSLELTQSVPSGTTLPMAGYRPTDDAWRSLIDGARERLDLAFFYASDAAGAHDSRLTPIVDAIIAAKRRGVWVRVVFEQVFLSQYPEIPRLLQNAGIAVRIVDRSSTTGGIVHAKMMAADGRRAWVGSANFDWRSLDHIHEVGVLVTSPALAEAVHRLVSYDVDLADDARPAAAPTSSELRYTLLSSRFGLVEAAFAASPTAWLPQEIAWDWPPLAALIASARDELDLEFLSYGIKQRDGHDWHALDDALRAAVARGVRVTLVVSSWAERGKHRADLEALVRAGVHVRIVSIPEHASGPIPFARVIHGKVAVADGTGCWVGTSNGEGDYFLKSRNAGFFLRGAGVCGHLRATVQGLATSTYAGALRPPLVDAP